MKSLPADQSTAQRLFNGGANVALKVPAGEMHRLLTFYRDTLGLDAHFSGTGSWVITFGPLTLWLDPSDSHRGEIWLEVVTSDVIRAKKHLASCGVPESSAIEALPADFPGFWITNPIGAVHLVAQHGA